VTLSRIFRETYPTTDDEINEISFLLKPQT